MLIALILAAPALVFAGIGQVQVWFLRARVLCLELDSAERRRITRETADMDLETLIQLAARHNVDDPSRDLLGVDGTDVVRGAEDILRDGGA